jgi:hypothetical protein
MHLISTIVIYEFFNRQKRFLPRTILEQQTISYQS